jgi:hypothetical protein
MPTIYEIRDNTIKTTIDQTEAQVTHFQASDEFPITLIHDTHVQMLQDKFNGNHGHQLHAHGVYLCLGA